MYWKCFRRVGEREELEKEQNIVNRQTRYRKYQTMQIGLSNLSDDVIIFMGRK